MKEKKLDRPSQLAAPMDEVTMGECLHLYATLGWTADIRAGHLLALGRETTHEAPWDETQGVDH